MDTKHTDPRAIDRIKKLPEFLQPHIEANDPCWSYCPQGWRGLVEQLHNHLVKVHPDYEIRQIKEKFGGLRFYTNIPYDANGLGTILISYYESRSVHVCDVCGEHGWKQEIDDGCYTATRCDDHNTREGAERAKVVEHDR